MGLLSQVCNEVLSRATSSDIFPGLCAWTESINVRCTNHLLVSRGQGDCSVAMDTPVDGEAPAINGSASASSLGMRLTAMSADCAGEW